MEEELRDLVRRKVLAPWSNLETTAFVRRTIEEALLRLGEGIHLMTRHRWGHEIYGYVPRAFEQYSRSASASLDNARRLLCILRARQASAFHVFALYGTHMGFPVGGDDPMWRCWEARRAEASDHYARALKHLRSAASHSKASRGAFLVAQMFSDMFNVTLCVRLAWFAVAVQLARYAYRDAVMAMDEVRRMGFAVAVGAEIANFLVVLMRRA